MVRRGTLRRESTLWRKKKCSNPNLFEKNISSRLSRKPFFNFFAREHQQQKLSELQFTGFNDFNDPTINFASRTFFASLKSFFAAGHFFLGCPHTTRFIETRFLQWADFFCAARTKSPWAVTRSVISRWGYANFSVTNKTHPIAAEILPLLESVPLA